MNKKRTAALYSRWVIATLTLILMGAVGCHHGNTLLENETDINQLPTSSVAFKLEQVLGQPGLRPDLGDSELREFDVYLERPDKGLKEEDWMGKDYNATSGLPFALRPKLILVSEVTDRVRDSGTSCYSTAVFPHRFPLTIKTAESQQAKTVLLKVVFGDNTYAEIEMTIPYVGRLTDPVVLEPVSAPKIGEKFQMRFKDVGADNYKVYMNICHPYANNGINPCLKGIELELARENGRFAVSYLGYVVAPNIGLTIESKNGAIELKSESQFTSSESGGPFNLAKNDISVRYLIIADAEGITEAGIKTYLESRYQVEYQLK